MTGDQFPREVLLKNENGRVIGHAEVGESEPFGRVVAEAWAAGCEVVTNQLVGAGYWIEHDPGAIETAADDFWRVVLS